MGRYRLLDPPHKGLRRALGELSLEAGRTDYGDPAEVRNLQVLARRVLLLLEDHAALEDGHVFPLAEARAPGSTAALHAEHAELDAEIERIVEAIDALDGTQSREDGHTLYLAVTGFQARYLGHLFEEERELEPLLWQHYSDEELRAAEAEVIASMDFALTLEWFRVIVPARSVAENREVVAVFRSVAPAEAVEAVVAVLRPELSPERLARILAD